MSGIFNYDFDEAQKAKNEGTAKTLGPGRYKMMVNQVEIGDHPFGGQFRQLDANEQLGPDSEIRVGCVLTEDANGFKSGWKHTLFFATMRPDKENPTKISKKSLIDRAFLGDLAIACCGGKPKSEQELLQKQFYITFKESTGKDGKTYLNIDKIESATSAYTAPVENPFVESNTSKPNWN